MWINIEAPYDETVHRLKEYYAQKANQGMIEHLIRQDAIRLGLWPQQPSQRPQPPAAVASPDPAADTVELREPVK